MAGSASVWADALPGHSPVRLAATHHLSWVMLLDPALTPSKSWIISALDPHSPRNGTEAGQSSGVDRVAGVERPRRAYRVLKVFLHYVGHARSPAIARRQCPFTGHLATPAIEGMVRVRRDQHRT